MKYIRKTKENYKQDYLFNLLKDRGIIKTKNDLDEFLKPNKEMLSSPYLLENIEAAVDCVIKHLENGSKILIPPDSDLDGFSSAAVLWNYLDEYSRLKDVKIELFYSIPQGKEHGFEVIYDNLKDNKIYDLILMADAGSNDFIYHEKLKNMGYDIVILDHHEVDEYSKNAIVVNNQISKEYTNKELTGVGVAYQFVRVLDEKLGVQLSDKYIDLAAIGIIGDMGAVTTKENRYIIHKGLKNIYNNGVKALVEKQAYSLKDIDNITSMGVAFYIAPLVNALIRVGTPKEKEMLFLSFICGDNKIESTKRGAKGEYETIAEQSARNCVNARARQNREKEKAMKQLEIQIFNEELDKNKVLILDADELTCSTNLTGLIAMGIAAKKKLPTMIGRTTPDGKSVRGSIRGLNGSELKDFRGLLLDSGLMEYVSGHSNAAGWGAPKSNLSKLLEYCNKALTDVNFNEGYYEVDFEMSGKDDIEELIFELGSAADLWGQNNNEPFILLSDLLVKKSDFKTMGKDGKTLELNYNGIKCIVFKADKIIEELDKMPEIFICSLIGRANINYWAGLEIPQLLVETMEFKNLLDDF